MGLLCIPTHPLLQVGLYNLLISGKLNVIWVCVTEDG